MAEINFQKVFSLCLSVSTSDQFVPKLGPRFIKFELKLLIVKFDKLFQEGLFKCFQMCF